MLRLLGIPGIPEARWLIAALYRDAHRPAVSAALRIDRGIDHDLYAVALTPDERKAMLGVLEDPPAGLRELRGVPMREHGGSPPICETRRSGERLPS